MIGGPGLLVVFVASLLAVCAVPLAATGLILYLCERIWEKRPGYFGSRKYLLTAFLLCLPIAALAAWSFVWPFLPWSGH